MTAERIEEALNRIQKAGGGFGRVLGGVIRASRCRFRRVSFDYPLGDEADRPQCL
jgi:hypothetical protein